ncbi:pyrroline-5-carboxylate reductase [Demequina activiva]|uniref:Pyrroline-5-carboxylate reductase n=1 Tax=Demequina activiva TaxID=1582364 RepID=A0A919UKI8_9MICO|nr:pyrroline-5-carboxylate reductase [Demequina activiva]GIG55015.1 pyrroline-5-carboxylate reductase [Demequina activiva]
MSEETTQSQAPRIAVVGGGVMGGTILTALRVGGWPDAKIVVAEQDRGRRDALAEAHGIHATGSISEAVEGAEAIVIAVKPQDAAEAMDAVAQTYKPGALVLTVAAGLPASFYEARLPEGSPVVRCMPNTPAIVAHGATAIAAGAHATQEHLGLAGAILRATGLVVAVKHEEQLDAVTAVSGSGPAYFYAVVEALAEAGVQQGLDRVLATQLAAQTFVGAARLLMESGDTPSTLRQRVSSPGGTTIAALEAMQEAGLPAVIKAGADAAAARSQQLGEELAG